MTDILLDNGNDILIRQGRAFLIPKKETLIRQRILNKLRTFSNTYWADRDYGLNVNLFFVKGSKNLLDKDIQDLVANTEGVIELKEFNSSVDKVTRVYTCDFTYKIETGEISGVKGLPIFAQEFVGEELTGIWRNGIWHYDGVWDKDEIWGS